MKEARLIEENPFWFYEPISRTSIDKKRLEWYNERIRPYLQIDLPEASSQLDVHKDTSRTLFVMGGNQSGKSVCATLEVIIMATGFIPFSLTKYPRSKIINENPSRVRVLCASNQVLNSTILPSFRKWVPRDALIKGEWGKSYRKGVLNLKRKDGGDVLIEFFSYMQNPNVFGGPARDILYFDEIPPYDIYLESLIRLSTARQPRIIMAATPVKGIASWVYEHVYADEYNEYQDISLHKLSSLFNPYVNPEVIEQIARTAGGADIARMRFMGEFVSTEGFVYADIFNKPKHVIPPFPITRHHLVVRGMDPHYSKPTVALEAAIDRDDNVFICGLYSGKGDSLEDVKEALAKRAKSRKYRLYTTIVDASSNVSSSLLGVNVFDELRRGNNRIPMLRASSKKSGVVENDIFRIREYLQSGKLFVFDTPELRPLIHSLETLENDGRILNNRSGRMQDRVLEMKHDAHACLRYIFQLPLRYIPEEETIFTQRREAYR